MMQTDLVESAYDDLVRLNLTPTVRRVRERIGHGSLTDINRIVASIREERALEQSASTSMPPALKERCDRILLQIWQLASSEAAERATEAEKVSEEKVRAMQEDVTAMLREGDVVIAELERLKSETVEAQTRQKELEKEVLILAQQRTSESIRADGFQQALTLLVSAGNRDRAERKKDLVPTKEAVGEAIFEVLKSGSYFDLTEDFNRQGWFSDRHHKKFRTLVDELIEDGVLQDVGSGRVALPGQWTIAQL